MAELIDYRRPSDADHDAIVKRIDDWAGGRNVRRLVARLWFRDFTSTSWVATREDGRVVGISIGYLSQDDPTVAMLHFIAVDPRHRHRGIGSELIARVARDARERHARTLRTTAPADDRPTIHFLASVGFQLLVPPDGQHLYGMPAVADYDLSGDDRSELERSLDAPEGG